MTGDDANPGILETYEEWEEKTTFQKKNETNKMTSAESASEGTTKPMLARNKTQTPTEMTET